MELSPNERTELLRISDALNRISSEKISISKNVTKSDFRRLKNIRQGFTSDLIILPEETAKLAQLTAKPEPCSCSVNENKCLAPECLHNGGYPPAYDRDGCLSEEYRRRGSGKRFIHECNAQCACNPEECLNRVVQRGSFVPKELCSIPGKGLGVRTLAPMKKGQFVGTYTGRLLDADAPDASSDPSDESNRYFFQVDDETGRVLYNIDAYKEGNLTRFMNHHCKPNVAVEFVYGKYSDLRIAEVAFFAKVDIPVKKELCFSYGIDYLKRVQMLCKCSSRTHIFEPVHQEYRFVVDSTRENPRGIYPVRVIRNVVVENAPGMVDRLPMYEVRVLGLPELKNVLVARAGIEPFTTQLLAKFQDYATDVQGEHGIALGEVKDVLKSMDPKPWDEPWKLSNLDLPEIRLDYEAAERKFQEWKPSLYFTERNMLKNPRQRLQEWRRRKVSGIRILPLKSSFGLSRDSRLVSDEKWKNNRLRAAKNWKYHQLRPAKKTR